MMEATINNIGRQIQANYPQLAEQGSDIIDLQDFAGHADPRTTLTYIRSRDRLSKSPK